MQAAGFYLLSGDPKFLHELVKSWPADPEFCGCRTDPARVPVQGAFNHFPFNSFPGFFQRDRRSGVRGICQFHVFNGYAFSRRP
jgi:hypothetical protein